MSQKYSLSVCIPARNEQFLSLTVDDLLKNIRGNTEIIVICDGNYPDPPIKDDPRVTLIYHSQSIGQRAACNEAARYSRAKYLAKCDSHCSFDEGFDVKLLEDMQDDWTMVPIMKNLWIYDWVCESGHRRYQGPSGPCTECGKPTVRDLKWIGKNNPQSTVYCFDPEPHFQYAVDFKKRDWYQKSLKETGLTETMSLQGSFFMLTRQKYFELNMNDEEFENWGSQGLEVAIKTWTSGGKVICSHKTWYSHCFHTQGGDFGFSWPCSGRQVARTKRRAKQVFFKQKWGPQQRYPLSWLVERFWPTSYWKDEDLRILKATEATFFDFDLKLFRVPGVVGSVPSPVTDHTSSVSSLVGRREQVPVSAMSQPGLPGDNLISGTTVLSDVGTSPTLTVGSTDSTDTKRRTVGKVSRGGQEVSSGAVSFGTVDGRNSIGGTEIINLQSQSEMERTTTSPIITDNMINNGNASGVTHRDGSDKPGESQSVHSEGVVVSDRVGETFEVAKPISILVETPQPVPAPSDRVNLNLGKNSVDVSCGKGGDYEKIGIRHESSHSKDLCLGLERCDEHRSIPNTIPQADKLRKCIIFYSDNELDETIFKAVQKQLLRSLNGNELISVTLKPIDFGKNIVLPLKRSHLSMARQQLAGLEASTADIIFFAEHDILYPKEHFDFTPPRKDVFYYNLNWYKVRTQDGQSLHFTAKQVSGLCAYRDILLDYYRKRVSMIESGEIGGRRHFEPGSNHYRDAYDKLTNLGSDTWRSSVPYVDIRHKGTVTRNIFDPSGYRNTMKDWTMVDEIPGGWGKTKGRFWEFLQEAVDAI